MRAMLKWAAAYVAAGLSTGQARADIVISTGPELIGSDLTGTRFTNTTLTRSIGFRVPESTEFANVNYMLSEVELGLNYIQNVPATVTLWEGDTGPLTFVTNMSTFLPPAGHVPFPFEPVTPVRLEPGSTYWVQVQASGAGSDFIWDGIDEGPIPSGTFASRGYLPNQGPLGSMRNRLQVRAHPILVSNWESAPTPGGSNLQNTARLSVRHVGLTTPPGQDWQVTRVRATVSGQSPAAPQLRVMSGIAPSVSRATLNGQTLSGQVDIAFAMNPEGVVLPGGGRHWFQLGLSNTTGYTWHGANPGDYFGTGTGFVATGGSITDNTDNRIEVRARPVAGHVAGSGTIDPGLGGGQASLTELIVPPGAKVRIHGVILQWASVVDTRDVRLEVLSGQNGPEDWLTVASTTETLTSSPATAMHLFLQPLTLDDSNRYWLVAVNPSATTSTSHFLLHPNRTSMRGVMRMGPTMIGGAPRGWADMTIVGLGYTTCPADLSGSTDPLDEAYGVPDGLVDATDFFFYLDAFALGDAYTGDLTASADPADPLRYGVKDGVLDSADFFYYLDLFAAGCP